MWTDARFCGRWTEGRDKTTRHHDSTIILGGRHDYFGVVESRYKGRKGREVVESCDFIDG